MFLQISLPPFAFPSYCYCQNKLHLKIFFKMKRKLRKFKTSQKSNPIFHIPCHFWTNKLFELTKQSSQKTQVCFIDTSVLYRHKCAFFSINILKTIDITRNSFLEAKFPNLLCRIFSYNSFFRFILLLICDINVNSGLTTMNNKKSIMLS